MLQLLDLAGIYFRAFFAVPTSTTSPDGRPVNAVRGSLDIIARVVADARPTRLIACLDLDWRPAWRVELIDTYKTHRVLEPAAAPGSTLTAVPEALTGALTGAGATPHSGGPGPSADIEVVPDELSPQVPILLDTLAAIGITVAGATGYEADDVIGTLAAAEATDPVEVVTGDRDLFQVARDEAPPVTVRYIGAGMSKAKVYTAADVAARYAIPVGSYAEFAALRGDPSDGLPGVPGVGDKTAATLIGRFGSVDGLVEALDSRNTGLAPGVRTKLANARDYLLVAPKVVRVATDAAVTVEPAGDGALPPEPADPGALSELVRAHGIGGPVNRLLQALASR
ncbi:5'-3' exonuclease H3TH domain-containing protein [Nakamurella sp.]|uniref:5'-3' exonuclease n=1 Tax=Nakamurella sp. TaxID=1869182 RepID=UPI003784A67B